ncbi:MAG: biopolymer transport protein ExbD, partial [Rhodothermales bacterium]
MLLATMGDIALLLIIFFMLEANFIKEAHVQVELPTSPDIDEIEDSQVSVVMDADALVYVQGQEVDFEVLADTLDGELSG